MRIDAHQHYWKISRGDYGWLTPDMGVLYRDYMPADLAPHLQSAGITATIAVQAAPTVEETEFLLSLCGKGTAIAGVVGWLDPEGEDFEAQLERMLRSPYFLGIRPMLQDLEDDAYLCRERVLRSLRILAERKVALDLLVKPRHLPYVVRMLEQVPNVRAVVDHIAKPDIAGQVFEPWLDGMKAVAAFPNVYCKLSGMVTEADRQGWTKEDIAPYVREICRLFGPDRVLFGSDWPVCLLAASYEEVVGLLSATLPDEWSEAEKNRVFGDNAAVFYNIRPTANNGENG